MAARTLITAPSTARRGEVIAIRVLIAHPMETGFRPGPDGRVLPRDIIRRFECRYSGEAVFVAELHPSVSANPYLAFHTVAGESGTLEFEWRGDNGFLHVERQQLTVSA